MTSASRAVILALAVLSAGCTHGLAGLRQPPASYAVATAPPFSSLVYAARADSAVVLVDLGWYGGSRGLKRALGRLGVAPAEVTDVFLTHSHRDHVGGWPLVRRARFHVAAEEVALLESWSSHHDLPSRGADLLLGGGNPWPGELDVRPFKQDTVFPLGRDTVYAFLLPGHTAGSAAYLFRRTLFVGDAFAWNRVTGLRRPARLFSADRARSREGLRRVLRQAQAIGMDRVCNAHAKCFQDSAFIARLSR
jgi:glyoxylase-like metal-dependent hydrolase (beta-lactamase superfamily II)